MVPRAPVLFAPAAIEYANAHVPAATEIDVICPATSAPAVQATPEVTASPFGSVTTKVVVIDCAFVAVVPVTVAVGVNVMARPETTAFVESVTSVEPVAVPANEYATVTLAACAGTTDKSPNPSEATATADTFFNEIVFTIFLSFSQIKDDLLSGW